MMVVVVVVVVGVVAVGCCGKGVEADRQEGRDRAMEVGSRWT